MNVRFIILGVYLTLSLTVMVACTSKTGISGALRGQSCIGHEFKLRVACYIVETDWKDKTLVLSPDHAPYYRLPLPVSSNHIGRSFRHDNIVGIVESGTVIRVVNVIQSKSFEYDVLMPYVLIVYSARNNTNTLNAYRLFNRDTDTPDILQQFAEDNKVATRDEVQKKGGESPPRR